MPSAEVPPLAAGASVAAMTPPTRPPVATSLLQGIEPQRAAQMLTHPRTAQAFKTVEEAERERRHEEDRGQAEDFFGRAQEAARASDPATWADQMAAGYRRIGRHGEAAKLMEYGMRARQDKEERERAVQDFQAISQAVSAWEQTPSPERFAAIHTAISASKSAFAKAFALEVTKAGLAKRLSADPQEHMFLAHVTGAMAESLKAGHPFDQEAAWRGAMERYPAGFAALWQRAILNPDKAGLPDFVWSLLKMERPPKSTDMGVNQRAWQSARALAAQRGVPADQKNPAFLRLWQDEINRITKEEHEAKQSEYDKRIRTARTEILEARAKVVKNPEAMSTAELRRQIDIGLTQLRMEKNGEIELSPGEVQEVREAVATLRVVWRQRVGETGSKAGVEPSKPRPPTLKPKQAQPPPDFTGMSEQEQLESAAAEARRLMAPPHNLTREQAKATMRQQKWPLVK